MVNWTCPQFQLLLTVDVNKLVDIKTTVLFMIRKHWDGLGNNKFDNKSAHINVNIV